MAQKHGKDGLVALGTGLVAAALDVVAEITSWSLDESAETYQTNEPTMNNPTPALTFAPGATSWTASMDCKFDDTDTEGQEAMSIGAEITVNFFDEVATNGAVASGDEMYQGSAIITGVGIADSSADITTRSYTIQGSGVLSRTALSS